MTDRYFTTLMMLAFAAAVISFHQFTLHNRSSGVYPKQAYALDQEFHTSASVIPAPPEELLTLAGLVR